MPGGGFKKVARHFEKTMDHTLSKPFNMVKRQIVRVINTQGKVYLNDFFRFKSQGDASSSFVRDALEEGTADEYDIKWISFSVYLAGSGTVRTAFLSLNHSSSMSCRPSPPSIVSSSA